MDRVLADTNVLQSGDAQLELICIRDRDDDVRLFREQDEVVTYYNRYYVIAGSVYYAEYVKDDDGDGVVLTNIEDDSLKAATEQEFKSSIVDGEVTPVAEATI